jgi:DNA-binding CsgD family transcriptional regulator
MEGPRKGEVSVAREAGEKAILDAPSSLTDREREVLALVAEGKTDAQIAEALSISTRTTSTHTGNILSKLGVQNRVQAAVLWDRYAETVAPMTGSQTGSENP